MVQVSVRIRLQDSIAAEPQEHNFENLQAEDGTTPFDLLLGALDSLSLSYGDFKPPTMLDAEGATLGTDDLVAPVTNGVTYEFVLAVEGNPDDSEKFHDALDVHEVTEVEASVGYEGRGSFIASRIGQGIFAAGNWMLNCLAFDDKPIEVIGVKRGDGLDHDSEEQRSKIVLNTAALGHILLGNDDANSLPVSIVSIAGLFRSGKSFLLNFFLRYLSHMEKVAAGRASPDDDWFEPTSDDDGITLDRFHWAAGRKGVTKGIHMWPKPFVLRRSSGEKIAVVLMDSQGTEDLDSDNGECVAVFALSTMIASLQIYNVKENINKQTLLRLHEFTQFANKALGSNRHDRKHFQSLVFLIRDSNEGSGFDIGTDEVWGAMKKGAMLQVGEDLALTFEKIAGFLMLPPGDSIHTGLTDRLRTYTNVLEAMAPGFRRNVKDFIETFLNPDTLSTARRALNYVKKWTESFRECRMPSSMTFFDATAEVHNQRAVECAVKAYASFVQERFTNAERPFPAAELERIHEASSADAYELFAVKSVGEDRHTENHLRRLDELIKGEHAAFKKINANLAVPVAKDTYDALWDDFVAREEQDCAHYHLKRAAFAAKEQEHRNLAVEKFYEFASRGDESSVDAMTKLGDELKISMLERKVTNGRKCYNHGMAVAQNSGEPWITSRLQSSHEESKKEALDVADLNRSGDGDYALARERLAREIKVAKASFIPPDMPGDKNVSAWDLAIAHYIKRMDQICSLYVSAYIEPRRFETETTRFVGDAKALFNYRCAKDQRSADFKETLMQEISSHEKEFAKINNKNWWWHTYKKVTTFVGAPFAAFMRRFARRGIGQQDGSGADDSGADDVPLPLVTIQGS